MQLIYILLSISIIVLLLMRKQIDFLSAGAITYILYTSPCLIGETWVLGYYNQQISQATYNVVNIQLFLIFLFIIYIFKKEKINVLVSQYHTKINYKSIIKDRSFWKILTIVSVIIFIYNILFLLGIDKFFSDAHKDEILEEFDIAMTMAIWTALACFLYFVKTRQFVMGFISFIMILSTFILGSRAYMATAIIGAFFIKSIYVVRNVKSNLKLALIGCLAVFLLVTYKYVYKAIRALDVSSAYNILSDSDMSGNLLLENGEFMTVFSIYNYVVDTNFILPLDDSIARLVSIIPFANNLVNTQYDIRLGGIAQEQFFASSYGVGGNFWAESYAMGGLYFVIVVTMIWLYLLNKAYTAFKRNNSNSVFIVIAATYCSFYIHRLDWVQMYGCLKSVFFVYLFYVFYSFFTKRKKQGKKMEPIANNNFTH